MYVYVYMYVYVDMYVLCECDMALLITSLAVIRNRVKRKPCTIDAMHRLGGEECCMCDAAVPAQKGVSSGRQRGAHCHQAGLAAIGRRQVGRAAGAHMHRACTWLLPFKLF